MSLKKKGVVTGMKSEDLKGVHWFKPQRNHCEVGWGRVGSGLQQSQESGEIEGEISSIDNILQKLCWEIKERGRGQRDLSQVKRDLHMWIHVGRTWRQWRSRGYRSCRSSKEMALGRAKALWDWRKWEPECRMHQRYRQPGKGQHGWCVWQKNNELHRLGVTQPLSQDSVRTKCTSTMRYTWLTITIIFNVYYSKMGIRKKQKRILNHHVTHWSAQ